MKFLTCFAVWNFKKGMFFQAETINVAVQFKKQKKNKVIIYIYIPVDIFLIVLGLFM